MGGSVGGSANQSQFFQKRSAMVKSMHVSQQGVVDIQVGGSDLQHEMDSYKLLPKVKNLAHKGYAYSSMNLSTLREESRIVRRDNAVNLKHLDK